MNTTNGFRFAELARGKLSMPEGYERFGGLQQWWAFLSRLDSEWSELVFALRQLYPNDDYGPAHRAEYFKRRVQEICRWNRLPFPAEVI